MNSTQIKELFDYSDGSLFWRIKPSHRIHVGAKAGSLRSDGYIGVLFKRKFYLAHRLIFLYHHGYLPRVIDHIDQNKSNNKIENLRDVTPSLNALNCKIRNTNTSGVTGVHRYRDKWRVQFRKQYYGDYGSFQEAVSIRTKIERDYYDRTPN